MSKEIDNLVSIYMAGGNVSCILNKMIQEGIDPATLTEAVQALDKARAIREGQKSITDGDALAIKTYGTIEQMKANFTKKWQENGDSDNIKPLTEQQVKLFTMMHQNKELPLKPFVPAEKDKQKPLDPMIAKKYRENTHQAS